MRMLLWLLIGYILFRVVKGFMADRPEVSQQKSDEEETVQDPVCGTYVPISDAVIGKLDNKRIYFCSMNCLDKYREQLEHQTRKQEDQS